MPSTAHSCLFLCSCFSNGCIVNASVHWSCYLHLNHWAEFHQTCYITSAHDKCVWEQHYFSVLPFDSLSVCQTISSKTTGQNWTNLATWLPHVVRATKAALFIHPSVRLLATELGDFEMGCRQLDNLVLFFFLFVCLVWFLQLLK